MNDSATNLWNQIIDDVRLYPSPHNSQPIKLRPHGQLEASLYYDLDLGLPAESFGIPFGHVCAGVFLETLRVVALASGFQVRETLDHREMDFDGTDRLHLFARVELVPASLDDAERRQAEHALQLVRTRRTSRRPYLAKSIPADTIRAVEELCEQMGQKFRHTNDRSLVRQIVHINQATLFDDLENDDVYTEIMHWLRFSKTEAATKADGLSAEAMLFPGKILRFAMSRRGMWRAPVLGSMIRWLYLNTMRGVHELGWLEGPFAGPADYLESGRTFMRVWLELHRRGVVLHPFGTVITNPRSHQRFAQAVNANENDSQMAWMLFRMGFSSYPPLAHRRSAEKMLLPQEAPREDTP